MSDRRGNYDLKHRREPIEERDSRSDRKSDRTLKSGSKSNEKSGSISGLTSVFKPEKKSASSFSSNDRKSSKGQKDFSSSEPRSLPPSQKPQNPIPPWTPQPACDAGCTQAPEPKGPKPRPRPRPPKRHDGYEDANYKQDRENWDGEYSTWKDETCACSKGYFCKAHGEWVSGADVRAGRVPSQQDENYSTCHSQLQPIHDDGEQEIEYFSSDESPGPISPSPENSPSYGPGPRNSKSGYSASSYPTGSGNSLDYYGPKKFVPPEYPSPYTAKSGQGSFTLGAYSGLPSGSSNSTYNATRVANTTYGYQPNAGKSVSQEFVGYGSGPRVLQGSYAFRPSSGLASGSSNSTYSTTRVTSNTYGYQPGAGGSVSQEPEGYGPGLRVLQGSGEEGDSGYDDFGYEE